jgi:hypothetical protein
MNPFTLAITPDVTYTVDLDHLIGVGPTMVNKGGVCMELFFLFRDAPVRLFRPYSHTEKYVDAREGIMLNLTKGGSVPLEGVEPLQALKQTLAFANWQEQVVKPLEAAWIG